MTYVFPEGTSLRCLAWSPDGRFLAAGGGDGHLKLFDVVTNKQIEEFDGRGHEACINAVCYSIDGKTIVSGCENGIIWFWDTASGKPIKSIKASGGVRCICLSSLGDHFLSGGQKNLQLWNLEQGMVFDFYKEIFSSNLNYIHDVRSVSFLLDGKFMVVGGVGHLTFWDVENGSLVHEVNENKGFYPLHIRRDGKVLVSGNGGGVDLWEIKKQSLEFIGAIDVGERYTIAVKFSPDNRFVVTASQDLKVRIFDAEGLEQVTSYGSAGHKDSVTSACFSPCGEHIFSGSRDQTICCWNTNNLQPIGPLTDRQSNIEYFDCSPDGRYIMISGDGKIDVWDKSSDTIISSLDEKKPCGSLQFSPDGRLILTTSFFSKSGLKIWSSLNFELINGVKTEGIGSCRQAKFSPSGKYIITAHKDNVLHCWDIRNKIFQPSFNWIVHDDYIKDFDLSPCGTSIASCDGRGTVFISDLERSVFLARLKIPGEYYFSSICFHPNGRYLLLGDRLLDVVNVQQVYSLPGSGFSHAIFSPNGKYIIGVKGGSVTNGLEVLSLEHILGPQWLEEYMNTPLILTAVWFPEESLKYMKETVQGIIVRNKPLARCGECGKLFPVENEWLGKEIRCPVEIKGRKCDRLLKLNEFTAGTKNS